VRFNYDEINTHPPPKILTGSVLELIIANDKLIGMITGIAINTVIDK
jgi:hypothetical protein